MPTDDLVYGPDVPDDVTLQRNNWTCAVRSTYVALYELAEKGLIEPVTYGDGGPRDVYDWLVPTYDDSGVGLHDHTGAGIVDALKTHGIDAQNAYPVTLADVQARAGRQPVLLGGDAWQHWVAVRGVEADETLILENPSPGWMGIQNELRDSFSQLGPMAMVWLDVPAPAPPPPALSSDWVVGSGLLEAMAKSGETPISDEIHLGEPGRGCAIVGSNIGRTWVWWDSLGYAVSYEGWLRP